MVYLVQINYLELEFVVRSKKSFEKFVHTFVWVENCIIAEKLLNKVSQFKHVVLPSLLSLVKYVYGLLS